MFSTLAIIWRLARPYFSSEDKWAGRVLLAAVIAIELSIVGINVLLNSWNNSFYNALQDKNWDAFAYQLGYFCVLATVYIFLRSISSISTMASDPLAPLAHGLTSSGSRINHTGCSCAATRL
jgi:ABC-type uncharacterized transport system fused permease/ATPase subunit